MPQMQITMGPLSIIFVLALLAASLDSTFSHGKKNQVQYAGEKNPKRPAIPVSQQVKTRIGFGTFDPEQGDAGIDLNPHYTLYKEFEKDKKPAGEKTEKLVYEALKRGYRVFDCAEEYGSDPTIGRVVNRAVKEGIIKSKDEVFLISKLAHTRMAPDDVEPNLRQTIRELDKIPDLFLIHHPYAMSYQRKDFLNSIDYVDVWRRFIIMHSMGLTKNIGVANFNESMVQRLIDETGIPPAAVQLETHPYHPNNDMLALCERYNITLIGYSPLSTPWHAKEAGKRPVIEDPVVQGIAKKHGKSPAQIVLQWHLQRSPLTIATPHSENLDHLEENIDVVKNPFTLSDDEINTINGLEKKGLEGRMFDFKPHRPAKYFPYEMEME